MPDDFLDADRIRAHTFLRHVEIHETLGSTNDRAAELARNENIGLPALVAARRQTAGRGRGQNRWWSSAGALTFSVLIAPTEVGIAASNWPLLSLATAVAVHDALSRELDMSEHRAGASSPTTGRADKSACSAQKSLANKWPNDIMLGSRKVCGILIESRGGVAPAKDRLIIGIGMNINNSCRNAPREIEESVTAICDFTAEQHDLTGLLVEFLQALQIRSKQLAAGADVLMSDLRRRCFLSGRQISVENRGVVIEGLCQGIDDDGALLIATATSIERVYSGTPNWRHFDPCPQHRS
jgi:BirA family biotin operon repressor/biotin-[acetyl-CoA-carboxylase] ligase